MKSAPPVAVPPVFHEKVWGATRLAPWFEDRPGKVGEVWFAAPGAPLLIKFLFTSENLSVQVHPEDSYARRHEHSPGKTEMWHILRAEPGARLAAGFRRAVPREELRAAAVSGEIVDLLAWHEPRPGDTFYIPAGTVHALGAGIAMCEIQQYSDVTYRLYDWGRTGRALHLDRGLEVAHLAPHAGPSAPVALGGGRARLAACPYFTTERIEWASAAVLEAHPDAYDALIVLAGEGTLAGQPFRPGQVWLLGPAEVVVDPAAPSTFLRSWAAAPHWRPR